MSISLLSLLVGHDGSAPMGLNLRSLGFGISIYSGFFFFVSTAFLFVWICEFLLVRRSYWLWRYSLLRSPFFFFFFFGEWFVYFAEFCDFLYYIIFCLYLLVCSWFHLSVKNLVLFFTRELSVSFLFWDISISLDFLSNSIRSSLSSPMLLIGVGQNLRSSLSWFIWSLFNLCVDKFITFCLMLLSFFF